VILLDTNVVSALMARRPEQAVVEWLDAQPSESVWTTAITVFEVQTGLELLEPGRRRRQLEDAFVELLGHDLGGRVQSFDERAALAAGGIAASRRRSGRNLEIRDLQIAGIATVRRATLATRNVRDFDELGIPVVDPWANETVMRRRPQRGSGRPDALRHAARREPVSSLESPGDRPASEAGRQERPLPHDRRDVDGAAAAS
jgi:toxin FitB